MRSSHHEAAGEREGDRVEIRAHLVRFRVRVKVRVGVRGRVRVRVRLRLRVRVRLRVGLRPTRRGTLVRPDPNPNLASAHHARVLAAELHGEHAGGHVVRQPHAERSHEDDRGTQRDGGPRAGRAARQQCHHYATEHRAAHEGSYSH